jgi:hypothetical protein
MTKRALAVILILILTPIIVVTVAISQFQKKNAVVAEYDGSVEVIEYDSMTLLKVPGEDQYNFRFGEYLGKVGNRLTGASLYRVEGDKTGKYFAIADGTSKILYTRSGRLVDGNRKPDSSITRLVFDDYFAEVTNEDDIAVLSRAGGKRISLDMSEHDSFKYYDLYLSFDGSAILTEHFGRLIYLTSREIWLLITPEELEAAEEEYGDEIAETVYVAERIADEELIKLLDHYIFGKKRPE